MIDSEVQPTLPGHTSLPIAAGIVIDQLLHLGHPKLLPHLQFSLFEFTWILFPLGLLILVLFSNNSLKGHGRREREEMEGNMSADKHHIQQKVTAAIREDRKKKYDTAVIISPVTLREIAKT